MCHFVDESAMAVICVVENHKIVRKQWMYLLPVKFHQIPFSGSRREVDDVSTNQRSFLFFPRNTNLLEDVDSLLSVKFRCILFCGCRGEIENASANQRPGRSSWFPFRSQKHKLVRGRWDLVYCQVTVNSVQQLQRKGRKCPSQSEAIAVILIFQSATKIQTW